MKNRYLLTEAESLQRAGGGGPSGQACTPAAGFRSWLLALCVGVTLLPSYAAVHEDNRGAGRGAPAMRGAQPQPQKRAPRAVPEKQAKALEQAKEEGVGVVWGGQMQSPLSVRGRDLAAKRGFTGGKGLQVRKGAPWKDNAIAVMDNLAPLYDIGDAEEEFEVKRVDDDKLGFHHVRLMQRHQGLRVVGSELTVHFNQDDAAYEVNGEYAPGIEVGTRPGVAAAAAAAAALDDMLEMGYADAAAAKEPELVVYAMDGAEPRLAWEMALSGTFPDKGPGYWRYWIDAQTGGVLLKYNDVKHIAPPTADGAPVTITGSILTGEGGGTVQVAGWLQNGYYYLHNTNLCWTIFNDAAVGYPDADDYAYRSTSNWGVSDRAEMSAAYNFNTSQRYFREVHGRNSYDNAGAIAQVYVHYGLNYGNAGWSPALQLFIVGDGDGWDFSNLAVLDVMGHELTHAVTEHSANLVYMNESGALNESFSDIFASSIEFYAQPDYRVYYPGTMPGRADWILGEDCWLWSLPMRDMRNPGRALDPQPSRYHGTDWWFAAGDNGGVHFNSGPHNFLYYLICDGGAGNNDSFLYNVAGIGVTNAEQIAYRVLTVYCTPNTSYAAIREAWYSATRDLFPGNAAILASVRHAWDAIMGVQPPPVITTGNPLPDGRDGNSYSLSFLATSVSPVYEWHFIEGILPPNFTFSSAGKLSGLCIQSGWYTFKVAAEANSGLLTTNEFSLFIRPPLETPLSESFHEEMEGPLTGWSQEIVSGGSGWRIRSGGAYQGKPRTGFDGDKIAYLGRWDEGGTLTLPNHVARLVSPLVTFSPGARAAQLSFHLFMEKYPLTWQDELRVYCTTDKQGGWGDPIAVYSSSFPVWSRQTVDLPLPEPGAKGLWIAFEGSALGGYGVCLDAVWIGDPIPALAIITPSPLPVALVETNYTDLVTLESIGGGLAGTGPYTYAVVGGAMPNGFGLTPDGVVTGCSMTAQSGTFVVQVTDDRGVTATKTFVLLVELPRAPVLSANFETPWGSFPPGWKIEVLPGASSNIKWAIKTGGGFNGISPPLAAHSPPFYAFLYGVPGLGGYMASRLVSPAIDLSQMPNNTRLTFWHFMQERSGKQDQLSIWYRNQPEGTWTMLTNFTETVTNWTQRAVQLPNLTGTYQIAFEGHALGGYGVAVDSIVINDDAASPIITTYPALPGGFRGFPYSTTLAAVGGITPYAWSLVSGALPAGLLLGTDGVISGTPTVDGYFPLSIEVMGADGRASTNSFTLRILPPGEIPFMESFNTPGVPVGWSLERVQGFVDWVTSVGTTSTYPGATPISAPEGNVSNACLWTANSGQTRARLVSPPINLGRVSSNAVLTFQLCMAPSVLGQDTLKVRYKADVSDSWETIAEYGGPIRKWTPLSVELPNPSSTYYIAFEGQVNKGYGVCVGDVVVFGDLEEALTPYERWVREKFPDSVWTDTGIVGPEATPMNDGTPNLFKYAMGLEPDEVDGGDWICGCITNLMDYTDGATTVPAGSYFYLRYRRSNDVEGVTFTVVEKPTLNAPAWTTSDILELKPWVPGTGPGWSWVYNVHLVPTTNSPSRFMRLNIELDP